MNQPHECRSQKTLANLWSGNGLDPASVRVSFSYCCRRKNKLPVGAVMVMLLVPLDVVTV